MAMLERLPFGSHEGLGERGLRLERGSLEVIKLFERRVRWEGDACAHIPAPGLGGGSEVMKVEILFRRPAVGRG